MRTVVVGTAGHIDHGKSALVEALTGTDPDRLKEEKARGITIELGFAHAAVAADVMASFVDVPGHERFVRAMLAGVGGIDLVLLVVAADESVMPQTREHFDICRLLGVERGLVVLTKIDAVDGGMVDLVADDVRTLVAGSFLEGAPVVPVSARTGEGLDVLRAALAAAARGVAPRDRDGATRLPIDRAFTMKGFGTVVTGTLVRGRVAENDELQLLPDGRRVKVRGLHVHGSPRRDATAGERVAVNVAGVEVGEVGRGSVLATADAYMATRRADVRVTMLAGATLKHGARVRVHQGTAELLARVSIAGAATVIEADASAAVRLRFERPAVLARGDRVIVRTYSPPLTIAGGVVLDPGPPRAGVRTARGVHRMAAMAMMDDGEADRVAALGVMLDTAGLGGLSVRDVTQRLGATRGEVARAIAPLVARSSAVSAGDWLIAASALTGPVDAMLEGLAAFHRAHPLAPGLGLEDARGRWFRAAPPPVIDAVVASLVEAGRLVATDTLALPSHRVSLTDDEQAASDWLEGRVRDGGLTPPDVSTLSSGAPYPAAAIERVLPLLVKTKRLVRLDALMFHREALERLKAEVVARKATAPGGRATVDVTAFKDTYNVSRKYAIPLLEYLDRERVTRRMGDVRVVL